MPFRLKPLFYKQPAKNRQYPLSWLVFIHAPPKYIPPRRSSFFLRGFATTSCNQFSSLHSYVTFSSISFQFVVGFIYFFYLGGTRVSGPSATDAAPSITYFLVCLFLCLFVKTLMMGPKSESTQSIFCCLKQHLSQVPLTVFLLLVEATYL